MKSLIERFNRKWMPVPESGCWIWVGSLAGKGYGHIRKGRANEGMIYAHRASFEIHKGNIPDGKMVCHTCDIPCCVNPDHLFLGTAQENLADCIRKNRFPKGETHVCAKFTAAQVKEIRSRKKHDRTVTQRMLAKEFNVSDSAIDNILQRRRWAHIS